MVFQRVQKGKTLFISGGSSSQTYFETLTIGVSGRPGLPITITQEVDAGHNGTVTLEEQNAGAITIRNNFCSQLGSPNSTYSNYLTNNNHGFWLTDRVSGSSFTSYNNTVHSGAHSLILGHLSSVDAQNNIIVPTSGTTGPGVRYDGNSPSSSSWNHNLIWAPNSTIATLNGSSKTWSQWQDMGFDLNGMNAAPVH